PTSVLSISATVEPSQSKLGSPEAFRNGRMANETAGAAGASGLLGDKSLSRKINPVIASRIAANAPPNFGQGIVCPQGRELAGNCNVAAACPPCHALRSARI